MVPTYMVTECIGSAEWSEPNITVTMKLWSKKSHRWGHWACPTSSYNSFPWRHSVLQRNRETSFIPVQLLKQGALTTSSYTNKISKSEKFKKVSAGLGEMAQRLHHNYCTCRRTRFGSSSQLGGSQSSVTPVLGDPAHFSDLSGY